MSRRILFVANGWEFLLAYRSHLIALMQERGWEVHLAAPGRPPSSAEIERRFCHNLELSRESRNLVQEVRAALKIARLIREVDPSVLEASTIKPVVYCALAAWFQQTPRVILWCAGLGMSSPALLSGSIKVERAVQWFLRKMPSKIGWTFVAENQFDAQFLSTDPERAGRDVRVIRGRGVSLERFSPASNGDAKTIDVLFAGRFLRSKGVLTFAEVARRLKEVDPLLRCALAGSPDAGNPDSVDDGQVSKWRQEGLFSHLGPVSDMPRLLAKTKVLCFPSTYGEGSPRIVMEAAAAGVPVACVFSPCMIGTVENGVTGVFAADTSAESVAAACLSLVRDPARATEMGKAAMMLARREFGSELALASTLRLYGETL